jgi:DNA primase
MMLETTNNKLLLSFINSVSTRDEISPDEFYEDVYKVLHPSKQPEPDNNLIGLSDEMPDYMVKKRGISQQVCLSHGIKYDESTDSVVIPIYDLAGRLAGTQSRVCYETNGNRYKNSRFSKQDCVFKSCHKYISGAPVVVVEGVFSVLKADTLGVPNFVSTLGSSPSEWQLRFLAGLCGQLRSPLYVWYDCDSAGMHGIGKVCEKIHNMCDIWVVPPVRNKDPADYVDIDEMESQLAKAQWLVELIG